MRSIISISFIILSLLLLVQCRSQNDEAQRLSWLTEDPLSIPFRTRFQRYDRPNLIRNGSFEAGRIFSIDSGRTSFAIDGWQLTGDDIEWVDLSMDSIYLPEEAFAGQRSVKISRDKAYETDVQGEGITSDFIRVIPGNYSFTFYTRLQNIYPNRARLGTRLFDAIEVKLLYYDRNKIPVNSKQYFPYLDQYIDISNKSLSFANFLNIPFFNWGKIIGKSYPFPFPEGDIPSNAHYVKVYIGLKGTGTMWIDSVALNYTEKNFSVAERMSEYTDTSFYMRRALVPSPKDLRYMESVIYYTANEEKTSLPIIVVPQQASQSILRAAYLLRDRIFEGIQLIPDSSVRKDDILITTQCTTSQLNDSRLILSIGKTSLYERYHEIMPDHDIAGHQQGYFIYTSNDITNLVFLQGNASIGNYYAALTAAQLFDKTRPIFHNARIIDYPDFDQRLYLITDSEKNDFESDAENLIQYKLNGGIVDISENRPFDFTYFNPDPLDKKYGTDEIFKTYGMISPDGVYPPSQTHDVTGALKKNENSGMLNALSAKALLSGMSGIIMAPLFQIPADSSLCYAQSLNLQEDHKSLSLLLNDILNDNPVNDSGRSLIYCPPYYNNEVMDLGNYFGYSDSEMPEIPKIWSGNSFFGASTDDADLQRYILYTDGSLPIYFDNTMLMNTEWAGYNGASPYYPEKLKLFNIFQPFGNTEIRDLYGRLNHTKIIVNQPAGSEINIIRLATAADFLWNMDQYNPDYSLWKVLVLRYGSHAARKLIEFAGYHAEMLEILFKLDQNEQIARNVKNGETELESMQNILTGLSDILGPDQSIVSELTSIYNDFQLQLSQFQDEIFIQ